MKSVKTGRRPSSFQLKKWYLDCITEEGEMLIGYTASLGWKSIMIPYTSLLEFDGRHPPENRTSIRPESFPEISDSGVYWRSKGLRLTGSWQTLQKMVKEPFRLYENEYGRISWHCILPRAEVKMNLRGRKIYGLGYAEHLDMTIAPWRLPIRELIWGRFLGRDISLVWTVWRGEHPRKLVLLNGKAVENVVVEDAALSWEGGALELSESIVIRNGPLIKTALAEVPIIRSLFPITTLNTHECKWRSRGKLLQGDQVHVGWAIHELVRFER